MSSMIFEFRNQQTLDLHQIFVLSKAMFMGNDLDKIGSEYLMVVIFLVYFNKKAIREKKVNSLLGKKTSMPTCVRNSFVLLNYFGIKRK